MSNKKATIYTGTGDNGTTSLIGGTRVRKDHIRVEAYGTIDELNAHLGLLSVVIEDDQTRLFIEKIEHNMLTIGCSLANEQKSEYTLSDEDIAVMQKAIDNLEASLPPMHSFIIPGGTEAAARANLCRTVCRRAERVLTTLRREQEIEQNIMTYINRLSDYLFLLQRQQLNGEEKKWEKTCR
ncbi:MAG: cob(I)yrinic acid a,c-diamide adenosyltransferase [Bacteroidaceae bacterium]|nr:cob(I)yrinic acid a,c-diamide adenosyltransferase [Bacteroidaceae bacterium]